VGAKTLHAKIRETPPENASFVALKNADLLPSGRRRSTKAMTFRRWVATTCQAAVFAAG